MLMRLEGYKSLTLKGHGCQYTAIYTRYMGFIKFKKHILYMFVFETLLYRLSDMLFTSWTMKLSQDPVNLWLVVELVPRQLGLHQGKKIKMTMEFEVHKRYILGATLPDDMVQRVLWWERQKKCSGRKKARAHGKEIMLWFFSMNYIFGEWRWRQEETKEWSNFIFFLEIVLLGIYSTNQHIHF
jgi:hypothetical protein